MIHEEIVVICLADSWRIIGVEPGAVTLFKGVEFWWHSEGERWSDSIIEMLRMCDDGTGSAKVGVEMLQVEFSC